MNAPRQCRPARRLVSTATLALFLLTVAVTGVWAQQATPVPVQADATPQPTATLIPTATPTLTALQSQLVLAQTYLQGKEYARAAALYAAVAEQDRGNTEALTGLKAALDGQAAQRATAAAPAPTAVPTVAPAEPRLTLARSFAKQFVELGGMALAALVLLIIIYLLAKALGWLLQGLREIWFTWALPLLRRPAIAPGFVIGDFTNGLAEEGVAAARIVSLAISEKLLSWNQLVQAREMPVESEAALSLGSLGWLKLLWSWIFPAPRGFYVTGALMRGPNGAYQLAVQRIEIAGNRVDRTATFEKAATTPDLAFRWLAGEVAKWLINPLDIEASQAIVPAMRHVAKSAGGVQLTASEVFDHALAQLLPVRQQITLGAVDFSDARQRIRNGEALLTQLPDGSNLRRELDSVLADLRRNIPAG